MSFIIRLVRPALVFVYLTGPVLAEDIDPGAIAAETGRRLIAREDGSKGCVVTLLADMAIGGRAIDGAEACGSTVPEIRDAAAWSLSDGQLLLIDPLRHVLARFDSGAEGDWAWHQAERRAGETLVLVPAPDGIDHVPTVREAEGSWILRRPGGETLCRVALALDDKANPPGGSLTLGSPCDPAVTRLKLDGWQILQMQVVLLGSDGDSLAFDPMPKGGFAKASSKGGKPLHMVRP